MSALTVSAIKSHRISDDGAQATITFTTKYVGDLDVTMPSACVKDLIAALSSTKSEKQPQDPKDSAKLTVTVPKTWLVMADTAVHHMVILAFDHQAETKAGYALNPDAAKKLAAVLVQKADTILNHQVSELADKTQSAR